jgi:4-alpha-glucanotransferase
MSALHALAKAAGVTRLWQDADSKDQVVPDAALATVLGALGYPAASEAQARASLAALEAEARQAPAFLSVDVGDTQALPDALAHARTAELQLEDGSSRSLAFDGGILPAIAEPGYHRLRIGGHELVLAVAPKRCLLPAELPGVGKGKLWGTAIQIPSLHDRPSAYGDFGDLRSALRLFAERGADAVAISPVHAPAAGQSKSFAPYSPSSRLFLNPAFADVPDVTQTNGGELIDWPVGLSSRQQALRDAYGVLSAGQRAEVQAWAQAQGPALQRQALFDALSLRLAGAGWRDWPPELHDPEGAAATRFAADHADEIDFQVFTQWLADRSLAAVQHEAKSSGMAVGLIADLAVGIDPGGSDAWNLQGAMLEGLTIGAPPDPLGPLGQNWGLTSFSPRGLRQSAFAPWIATIRTALRHAGGIRIDHAFGLARLWVVPQGAAASEGAYLAYPFEDLLRILAIESHRAGAVIVGEDLGTRPPGFVEPVVTRGMLGMRVLWFERDEDGAFIPAEDFPEQALAMTGTHDVATVAGWWRGRDLEWNRRLGRGGGDWQDEEKRRMADRKALWSTIGNGAAMPPQNDPAPVVEAALRHLGGTASALTIVPLEDLLALDEQPNLPGTIDEHPNWRRRLSGPLADLLAEPATARRISALVEARSA